MATTSNATYPSPYVGTAAGGPGSGHGLGIYDPRSHIIDQMSVDARMRLLELETQQRRSDYTIDIRFVDDKVVILVKSKSSPEIIEYIGDDIDQAMEKIKAHMVKQRMNLPVQS
jgi:hypothetical protein